MKRITISFIIIGCIILSSVLFLFNMNRDNQNLFDMIDQAEQLYEMDSPDLENKIKEIENEWEKYYIKYSYVTTCSVLDDISYSVAKLLSLYENQEDEFIPSCESIKYQVKRAYDRQFPYLHSIL
ncbi:MAG: DUF4363 family protein [Oscillospiraceae bacterium]